MPKPLITVLMPTKNWITESASRMSALVYPIFFSRAVCVSMPNLQLLRTTVAQARNSLTLGSRLPCPMTSLRFSQAAFSTCGLLANTLYALGTLPQWAIISS